jgi:TatD DNase family protein
MRVSLACRLATRVHTALRVGLTSTPSSSHPRRPKPARITTATMSGGDAPTKRRYIDVGANLTDGHVPRRVPRQDLPRPGPGRRPPPRVGRRGWRRSWSRRARSPRRAKPSSSPKDSTAHRLKHRVPTTNPQPRRGACSRRWGCIRRDAASSKPPAMPTRTSNPSPRSRANTAVVKLAGASWRSASAGLDYDRIQFCDPETQRIWFERQFEITRATGLPMFLHMRAAAEDFTAIVRANLDGFNGGCVHSFTGTWEEARALLDLHPDIYVGINGCSLRTDESLEVVKKLPNDRIMIETDAPWCGIKPSHPGHSSIQTKWPAKDKKKRGGIDTGETVKDRSEPCHIAQGARSSRGGQRGGRGRRWRRFTGGTRSNCSSRRNTQLSSR